MYFFNSDNVGYRRERIGIDEHMRRGSGIEEVLSQIVMGADVYTIKNAVSYRVVAKRLIKKEREFEVRRERKGRIETEKRRLTSGEIRKFRYDRSLFGICGFWVPERFRDLPRLITREDISKLLDYLEEIPLDFRYKFELLSEKGKIIEVRNRLTVRDYWQAFRN